MREMPTKRQRKSAKTTSRTKSVRQVKFSSLSLPISKPTKRKKAALAKVPPARSLIRRLWSKFRTKKQNSPQNSSSRGKFKTSTSSNLNWKMSILELRALLPVTTKQTQTKKKKRSLNTQNSQNKRKTTHQTSIKSPIKNKSHKCRLLSIKMLKFSRSVWF